MGNFRVERRGDFGGALIGGSWHGDAGGGLIRSGASYVMVLGEHIWVSLLGPKLEADPKFREAIDKVLAMLS